MAFIGRRSIVKTAAKLFAVIVFTALLVFGAIILGLRIKHLDFYGSTFKEFEVPGLNDGFVPQGLDYCGQQSVFLISGYESGSNKAMVYAVTPNGNFRGFSLKSADGETLVCHSGGISHTEKYVYVVGGGKCYVFPFAGFFSDDDTSVTAVQSFDSFNRASFCCCDNDYLYIGEYYYPIGYGTDASHHVTTPAGDKNKAVITAFRVEDSSPVGVNANPAFAVSTTERIQGMCFSKDKVFLSASSAFRGSQIYVYDYSGAKESVGSLSIDGCEIPLYYLDSGNLISTTEVLPKSEGIIILGDRLYMLFESASRRFMYGRLLDGQYVYSAPMDFFGL